MRFSPGTRLGPYEIRAPLGAGGMGEVYRAVDTRLGREVAVKILGAELVDSPEALRRFEREARAVAALSHPNILSIFEFDIEANTPIVVTELLEGTTLGRREDPRMPWRRAAEIAATVADGLAFAHGRGIIHRDLKPENIFLTSDGRVKIVDFGIAHIREATAEGAVDPSAPTPTAPSRRAIGTIGYGSPEQLKGGAPAPANDIFSLGVVLYEIVSGKHPFRANSSAETIAAVMHDDPPPLTQRTPGTPLAFDRIVRRCLEKNPEQRFQSARDLAYQLREVVREAEAPARAARPLRRWIVLAASALAVAGVLTTIYSYRSLVPRPAVRAPITSLAILPLANATRDPSFDYLTDGITDGLINQLSGLPNIHVTARPTAFLYKSQQIDPARIGKELSVAALATGRVDLHGNNVVIDADLIDTKDGTQLWGNTYRRGRDDMFSLPGEIARQIASELRLELSAPQEARLRRPPTTSGVAYDLYLKGLQALNRNTTNGWSEAITFFQKAVESDPDFARAWAGLAESYARYSLYAEPGLTRRKAREAVGHALQLDPDLAEAHVSSGLLHLWDEWNLDAAAKEFKSAIELNSNLAAAHESYCSVLRYDAKFGEAIREARRAKELDPLSRTASTNLASTLFYAGQNEAAIAELTRLRTTAPDYPTAHYLLARCYAQQGRTDEACAEFVKSDEVAGHDSSRTAAVRQACAQSGLPGYYKERLRFLLMQESRNRNYEVGTLYMQLGEKAKAYQYFERAYEDHDPALLLLKADPAFRNIRAESRFQTLMARVGLRNESLTPQH